MHRISTFAALAVLGALIAPAAHAQSYPDRPIRLIVPFTPGGSQDIIGRLFAQALSNAIGQQVAVDNRGGAGGIIAAEATAQAAPDGYTILLATAGQLSIAPALQKKLSYDPLKDLAHVIHIVDTPLALLVSPKQPIRSVPELVALAKASPGRLNYGSTGNGTNTHLLGEELKQLAGIDMVHVPYKGAAPAFTDLIAGQVQAMFVTTASAAAYTGDGRLRAIAVTSRARTPSMPDVPSMIEQGFPDFEASVWVGISAPAKTPDAIVRRLNEEFRKALARDDVKAKLQPLGAVGTGSTPDEFTALVRNDTERWARVVRRANITLD